MSIFGSATVAAGAQALATQYNNLRLDVLQAGGDINVTTGSANAYLLALDAQITSIVQYATFKFKASFTNTAGATLNINSIGAITLVKNGSIALQQGDITSGQIYDIIYDGTNFQLQSPVPTQVQYDSDSQIIHGTMGDTFSGTDITNNLNLAYLDPTTQTWKKTTSTTSTWYHKLGLVLEATTSGNVGRILLRGTYANQTFNNINPTFSGAGTGTSNNVGNAAASAAIAFLIDNSSGAESVISGAGQISLKKSGAPAVSLNVYLVLDNKENSGYPVWNYSGSSPTYHHYGAILATATIAAAGVTTSFTNISFTLSGALNIPAGSKVYLVFATISTDASNFYVIQSGSATAANNSGAWSGTAVAANYSLTVTSTSPVGYAVKTYQTTSGDYGLTPANPWSRPIGRVLSSTTFFFDPEWTREDFSISTSNFTNSGTQHYNKITTNFCPAYIRVRAASQVSGGGFNGYMAQDGFIRADKSSTSFVCVGNGDSDNGALQGSAGTTLQTFFIGAAAPGSTGPIRSTQNQLHFVRLEQGFYVYIGNPNNTTWIGANTLYLALSVFSYAS